MMVHAEAVFEPKTFTVIAPTTVHINRGFSISIRLTAAGVFKTTIRRDDTGEETEIAPTNTAAVAAGNTDVFRYSKAFKIDFEGTYTFTITVYGKNGGTAVKTATVVVKQ